MAVFGDLFRWLFNEVPRRCMAAGLVKDEGFAVDACIIKADASRQRGVASDQVDWSDPKLSSHAVREYLEALDEDALVEALPKKISLTDSQSRWTAVPGGARADEKWGNFADDREKAAKAGRKGGQRSKREVPVESPARISGLPKRARGVSQLFVQGIPYGVALHGC